MTNLFRNVGIGAVLSGAALAVQAQTEYSVYGVADFSYGRLEPSGTYRDYGFNSNSLSPSFLGVNLKRGLEGGWTPGITLETFVRFQDFKTGRRDSDPLLSRNAFVSLDSDYGTLRIGRQQTYLFNSTVTFNAMGNSVFSPAIRSVFGSGGLESVQGDFYWDRAIGYLSPNWEGVNLKAMYAQGSSDERGDYSGATLTVSRGLFAAALSVQRVHVADGINDPTDENTWQLGTSYNFGVARVFAQYTQTQDRGLDVRSKIATAGVAVPLGPGNVLMQAAQTTATGPAVDRKHTLVAGGYVYDYDSLISLYLVGQSDSIRGQTNGLSVFAGARIIFSVP